MQGEKFQILGVEHFLQRKHSLLGPYTRNLAGSYGQKTVCQSIKQIAYGIYLRCESPKVLSNEGNPKGQCPIAFRKLENFDLDNISRTQVGSFEKTWVWSSKKKQFCWPILTNWCYQDSITWWKPDTYLMKIHVHKNNFLLRPWSKK